LDGCYGVLAGVIGMGDGQGHTFREYDYRDATGIRHVGMGMCIEAVVRLFSWQWHGASGTRYAYGLGRMHIRGCSRGCFKIGLSRGASDGFLWHVL